MIARRWLASFGDWMVASDPGLARLRFASRTTTSAALALGATYGFISGGGPMPVMATGDRDGVAGHGRSGSKLAALGQPGAAAPPQPEPASRGGESSPPAAATGNRFLPSTRQAIPPSTCPLSHAESTTWSAWGDLDKQTSQFSSRVQAIFCYPFLIALSFTIFFDMSARNNQGAIRSHLRLRADTR